MEHWKGIGKLIEEAGELQQVAGKAIPFPLEDHPDGKGPVRERFIEECADMYAILDYFCEVNGLPVHTIDERRNEKYIKFCTWGLTGVQP